MASSDQTSRKSLVLKPEKASLLDLFHILFSGEIESRKFVECLKVKEKFLERGGMIFFSVVVQKVLQFIAKPMSWFGSKFELWLNLVSSNNNFGKMIMLDRESATFLSVVGYLDKRVELDRSIKPGDSRYYGAISAMASKLAYENKAFIKTIVEDHWKMELLGAFDFWNGYQQKSTTQAFMFHDKNVDPDMIVVAFRGTEIFDADAWCTDFDLSWHKFQGVGKVHSGFIKALGLQNDQHWPPKVEQNNDRLLAYYAIRERLRENFQMNNRAKFILTGHSLGGALSVLFPAVLALHNEASILARLEAVYTFGQPRVGDKKQGEFMKEQFRKYGVRYYRFVYSHDIVPRLPYDNSTVMFKHFGTCLYYNSIYEGKIVPEEPYKNYFSLVSFIPKRLDAFWELVRSVIIAYTNVPDYKEDLLLQMLRAFGIIFPGFAAHSLQDYINATRLGSPDIFHYHKEQTY